MLESLFYGLMTSLHHLLFVKKNCLIKALGFAFLWGLFESLRSVFLGGFPWVLAGDAQSDSVLTPLLPILGSQGTGVFFVLIATLLASSVPKLNHRARQERVKGFLLLATMMFLFLIPLTLKGINWTTPKELKPLKVKLIQGNVSEKDKQSANHIGSILEHYQRLSFKDPQASVVIWPESILAFTESSISPYLEFVYQQLKEKKKILIYGLPTANKHKHYHTSMIQTGRKISYYHKEHLVPFGEYLPIPGLSPLLKHLEIEEPLFSPGKNQQALLVNGVKIAPFICYDIAYASSVNQHEGEVLLTLTDDAWFGQSKALRQHQQIARVRAIEQGKPHLFVSNNGLTSLIDANGHVLQSAPLYQVATLDASVTPYTGQTPWHWLGFRRLLCLELLALLILVVL
jgi:apolipoprotein N-acyltransferase